MALDMLVTYANRIERSNSLSELYDCLDEITQEITQTKKETGFDRHDPQNVQYNDLTQQIIDALFCKDWFSSDPKQQGYEQKGRYNLHPQHRFCIQVRLLQLLSQWKIPLDKEISADIRQRKGCGSKRITYRDILETLLDETEKYFNFKFKQYTDVSEVTHTLSALSRLEYQPLKIDTLLSCIDQHMTVECLSKMCPSHSIRYLHSMILLGNPENGFRNRLSQEKATALLNYISATLTNEPLQTHNTTDRMLAQQLIQIRNVYSDIFPAELSGQISPFIALANSNTHGSRFEREIQQKMQPIIAALQKEYPGMINPHNFYYTNPISNTLGIESDMTYENPTHGIKVCIQIDGEKYHTHPSSKRQTQRTLLRDFCFQKENWDIIVFSDDKKDARIIEKELRNKIIIRMYDSLLEKNKAALSTLEPYYLEIGQQKEQCITDRAALQNALDTIATIHSKEANDLRRSISEKIGTLDMFNALLSKLQDTFDVKKQILNDAYPIFDTINTITASIVKTKNAQKACQKELDIQQKKVDALNRELQSESYQRPISKIKKELAQFEKSLHSTQANFDSLAAQITALKKERKAAKAQLETVAEMTSFIHDLEALKQQHEAMSWNTLELVQRAMQLQEKPGSNKQYTPGFRGRGSRGRGGHSQQAGSIAQHAAQHANRTNRSKIASEKKVH